MKKLATVVITALLIGILLIGVNELPPFGNIDNPSHNYVSKTYLKDTLNKTGALNIITGIILDYRAFDTFIEATVLFTGAMVVLIILRKDGGMNG